MASAACPVAFSTPSCAVLEALSITEREGQKLTDKQKAWKNAPWFNSHDGKGKCENVYSIKIQGLQSYEATSEDSWNVLYHLYLLCELMLLLKLTWSKKDKKKHNFLVWLHITDFVGTEMLFKIISSPNITT